MLKYSNLNLLLSVLCLLVISCSEEASIITPDPEVDPSPEAVETVHFFAAIESATDPATDVLSPASSFEDGMISPVNNGFEQPAWMTFIQGIDQILVGGYTSAPEFVSYEMVDGELTQGESFFTDLTVYAFDIVDESTAVLVGSPREGLAEKKIYLVDTDDMSIVNTATSTFGNNDIDSLLAFPNDVKVRGDKMFISYYHIGADGSFSTPMTDQIAEVAVFNYPSLQFEKIITDDRAPNLGRYYTTHALEVDEAGNIYTFSPSSLACGYSPVPEKNSAILRIPAGSTDFDPSYYIDFESISGGYKINDLFYVADGKAVVRVLQEVEDDPAFLWATYAPTSDNPLLSTGILDLTTGEFTLLPDVPMSGGGWNSATMVDGSNLYLGVNNSTYAGIYIIDVASGIAKEGAAIDGNYAKGILSLSTIEEQ